MHNLDSIVGMYYSAVSAQAILEERIKFDGFPRQEFADLRKAYDQKYSETEARELYAYAMSSGQEMGHPFSRMQDRSALNVFAALEELAEQLLVLENNQVKCIYGELLRFRKVTDYIEEDLLVCAYLAVFYKEYGRIHTDFSWNVTIGHNNMQLRRIMEKGISENHFHLYGSAPAFHLLWIHFMNHVDSHIVSEIAKRIEGRQRATRRHYNLQYTEESFGIRILKAALIRIYIMSYLLEDEIVNSYNMEEMLLGKIDIRDSFYEIQKAIDEVRNRAFLQNNEEVTDYALFYVKGLGGTETENYWFAGERWLMYQMMVKELSGDADGDKRYFQLFYAYLVLKQNVRSELVQVNDAVGFENFSVYSKRKQGYGDYKKMIETAIYGSMESGNIRSLEIRITPGKSAIDNARNICQIDSVIAERERHISRSEYYYVFHFSKEKDKPVEGDPFFYSFYCRHYRKRRELEKQACGIIDFRNKYCEIASEVLGIDACSQEIGCRPEVFAPVFRVLSKHVVEKVVGKEKLEIQQLKKTFHVGEDFLDVVDGLRAIDEAVHFLDLQCGDRIGHGTVLGIDAEKWYSFKRNTILLPEQDYLDNIVWLYHKLTEYRIEGMDDLRAELLREFELSFARIYLHRKDGDKKEDLRFNIHTYYEAWKLRGDEPVLYRNGYFNKEDILDRVWFVNDRFPERFEGRERPEIAGLYSMYHYDEDVKRNGEKVVQVYVTSSYKRGVRAVQREMRRKFAALGIGVETNPSSNLAISPFESYSEHPVVTMYNKDMTWDLEQLKECPQINVSINTDDKGIFHTSLENEYALMGCAMEKARDENGKPLYNRQMIYQWIDNIREMGNMQSFDEGKRWIRED